MKVINLTEDANLVLEVKKTKNGFKHIASYVKNNKEEVKAEVHYINRTWEQFEFQSVIKKLFEKLKFDKNVIEILFNKIRTTL
jgi:hypothetical protein